MQEKINFQLFYEEPSIDPTLSEPTYLKTLSEIGIGNIMSGINIRFDSSYIVYDISSNIFSQMSSEQRYIILSHLEHILKNMIGEVYIDHTICLIKSTIYQHILKLISLEEEPGEFDTNYG
jgi:hypothetical protein